MRNVFGRHCAIRRWSFGRRRLWWILLLAILFFIPIYNHVPLFGDQSGIEARDHDAVVGWKTSAVSSDSQSDREIGDGRWHENGISKRDSKSVSGLGDIGQRNRVTRIVLKAVHLAVVACGDRIEEPLMMLKSAVTFGEKPIHVHVFTDEPLWSKFSESVRITGLDQG